MTVLEASDPSAAEPALSEMIVPGLLHDHCSASTRLPPDHRSWRTDLAADGLTWLQPEIDCAHPLDDGSAGALYRRSTHRRRARGRRSALATMFGRRVASTTCSPTSSQPVLRCPRHPMTLAALRRRRVLPAPPWAGRGHGAGAALWAGVAAHAFHRLDRPMTSAVGLMLIAAGHATGWVVAEGGSQAIADALPPTSNATAADRDRRACDARPTICRRATC